MWPRLRLRSLRTKIILWTFVPTMIILVFVAMSIFDAYQGVTEVLVIERNRYVTRVVAGRLANSLFTYADLLTAEARKSAVYLHEPTAQQTSLNQSYEKLSRFDAGVVIVDSTGQVVAATPDRLEIVQQNWSDRPCYQQVLRSYQSGSATAYFSDIMGDGPAGSDSIGIAVPITDPGGEFGGVIVGMLSVGRNGLEILREEIAEIEQQTGGEAYLVDSRGIALYHSRTELVGTDFSSQPMVQQALEGEIGAISVRDGRKQNFVVSYAPVPGTSWGMVVREEWTALSGAIQEDRRFLLILLILGMAVPVLLVAYGVKQVIQPIEDLTTAAQEVSRGNFDHQIKAPTGDELEKLAEQFNIMALQLHESYNNLEQKVADRTRELTTLLEISRNVASTLDIGPLLGTILDQLKSIIEYDGASILTLGGTDLEVLAYRGPIPSVQALTVRFPLNVAKANNEVILRREPVIISDVRGDADLARAFQEAAGEQLLTTFSYVRSWMGVPLIAKGQVIGMISFDSSEPDHYQPPQAELAQVFANQVAVAIENARLYDETRRRADEIQTLFTVQQAIAGPLEWEAVLQLIADEARRLTSTRFSAVFLLDGDTLRLSVFSGGPILGFPIGYRIPLDKSLCGLALESSSPILIANVQTDPRVGMDMVQVMGMRSLLIVPLLTESRSIGVIMVTDKSPGLLGPDDERVLSMLASGAVIQLENARLFRQAQQVATIEERQRLARELHDAVTQTLFSASLIAEVLPRIWERDPQEGIRRLAELRQLTRGALAEMRTLLLELRPAALVDTEMTDLLHQLAESITGRARVPVSVEAEHTCPLPPRVKVALYRIAQEALNNIAKHAVAGQATIGLSCTDDEVILSIRDNGRGFDPNDTSPENLGLGIMYERAAAIGAALKIESEPGKGTQLTVIWPIAEERSLHE